MVTIYGIIGILCSICGIVGNTFSLKYFFKRRNNVFSFVLLIISIFDISVCVLISPIVLSYLNNRKPMLFESYTFCQSFTFLWSMVIRMSSFLVLILSVARTLTIIRPFTTLKYKLIKISIVFYFILVLTVSPQYVGLPSKYEHLIGSCMWDIFHSVPGTTMILRSAVTAIQLQVFIPAVPMVLTCGLSIHKLYITRTTIRRHARRFNRNCAKYKSGVTIVIVTLFYFINHFPIFIMGSLAATKAVLSENKSAYNVPGPWWLIPYVLSYFGRFSIVINSSINPLIYVIRLESFRRSVLGVLVASTTIFKRSLVFLAGLMLKMMTIPPNNNTLHTVRYVNLFEGCNNEIHEDSCLSSEIVADTEDSTKEATLIYESCV